MSRVLWSVASAAAIAVLLFIAAGWRPVVLVSDSMAPTAPAGSLLITRPVDPVDVTVDDILTVPLPAGDGRITHRVVELQVEEDGRWVRLQGDANTAPDAGRVRLEGDVLRTVTVLPVVGRVVGGGNPVLLVGILLLLVGTLGLAFVERRARRDDDDARGRHEPRLPTGTGGLDTRALALLATLEALAEDGMDRQTLEALGRARIGALLGLGAVEACPEAAVLDDGARFVLIALADADADALRVVPPASTRATEARDVVTEWWHRHEDGVPTVVREELQDVLTGPSADGAVDEQVVTEGGIGRTGPVD